MFEQYHTEGWLFTSSEVKQKLKKFNTQLDALIEPINNYLFDNNRYKKGKILKNNNIANKPLLVTLPNPKIIIGIMSIYNKVSNNLFSNFITTVDNSIGYTMDNSYSVSSKTLSPKYDITTNPFIDTTHIYDVFINEIQYTNSSCTRLIGCGPFILKKEKLLYNPMFEKKD